MKKKKSIVALLSVLAVSVSSVLAIPVGAAPEQDSIVVEPATPQYSHAEIISSALTINQGTATCISEGRGQSHVASMNCMQYLEKKNWLGNYSIIVNKWFKSASGSYLYMANTEAGLGSGTYRLRGVFTFYAVGGYEEATAYSHEVKYKP